MWFSYSKVKDNAISKYQLVVLLGDQLKCITWTDSNSVGNGTNTTLLISGHTVSWYISSHAYNGNWLETLLYDKLRIDTNIGNYLTWIVDNTEFPIHRTHAV